MKIGLTSDIHYGFADNTQSKLTRFFQDLAKENLDYFIIAGDIAITNQHQFKRCLELARSYLKCDIGIVRGNHDFWERIHDKDPRSGKRSLMEVYKFHEEVCKDNNITILTENPIILEDRISIYGFDGWYRMVDCGSNDQLNIPKYVEGCPSMSYLIDKAWRDIDNVLENARKDDKFKILVTHHNLYNEPFFYDDSMAGILQAYPEVKENFDVLCCGHTHVFQDYMDENLRVLNCGSDYNNPKSIIFDI